MEQSVLKISRGLHQTVQFLERLVGQASASLTELREIKEQLQLQNEQGRDSQLLTLEEMAEKLKVSVKTMFTWSRTGVLPSIRIGYGNYYRISDLIKRGLNATQDEEPTKQP